MEEAGRTSEGPESASERTGRASEVAGRASEPARRASDPAGKTSEPAGRTSDLGGRLGGDGKKRKQLHKRYMVSGSFCLTSFHDVESHVSLVVIWQRIRRGQ